MVFFVRITVNQSHLRPICKSTKFNPKIQRTIYSINFQRLRLHVMDFIRTVVLSLFKNECIKFILFSYLCLHLVPRGGKNDAIQLSQVLELKKLKELKKLRQQHLWTQK